VNRSRKPAKQRAKKSAPRARARSGTAKPTSARSPRTAAKKPPKPAALLLYLYGITRAKADSPRAPGVDGGAAVEAIACSGLTCWVSRVDAREFGEELEANIENLDWLAEASVRHQRVVSELSSRAESILPARFGTVFLTEKTLAADVARRKADLEPALKRLANTDEWGVKVFRVEEPVHAAIAAESGRDYLQQKAASIRPTGAAQLAEEVKSFAKALAKVAADAVPGGKVSGGQRGLEWQASFLLRRSDRKKWDDVLTKFARRWGYERRIETTGPWPPYSFVSPHAR
jgi:hypothetical protein